MVSSLEAWSCLEPRELVVDLQEVVKMVDVVDDMKVEVLDLQEELRSSGVGSLLASSNLLVSFILLASSPDSSLPDSLDLLASSPDLLTCPLDSSLLCSSPALLA